jgi:MFS family permease
VGAFDLPARQALVPMLVPREDLPNAIGLNASMMQMASVAGPALAGVLLADAGIGWVYVVNAISFACVIVALLLMRNVPDREANGSGEAANDVSLLVPPHRKGLALGLVGLVRVVPVVCFSMISGVVADAWDRRKLMIVTQVGSTLATLALAALTFRGLSTVWPIYVLAAIGGAIGTFDLPARQALVPTLVPREHLPNAISLNTIMFQAASVVGPSLGGVVIAATSVGWVYLVNALSFSVVIVALLMMRDVPERPSSGTGRDEVSLAAALEGLRFVFRSPLIRSTMLLDFFATFFSSATALLPIFAQDVLQVGARGYGWLFAAPAAGALVMSAAMVPLAERIERRGATLLWAIAGYGLATVVFGLSRSFWLTFACLALTGATDTVSMAPTAGAAYNQP